MELTLTPAELDSLLYDRAYGLYTRPALELVYNRRAEQNGLGWAILIDIDNIHNINSQFAEQNGTDGYAETDALLHQAFANVRKTDAVIGGRYKSGDECAFLIGITANPQAFCERLLAELAAVGLSATMVYTQATPSFDQTFKAAGALLQTAKRENNRGTISRR